MKKQEAKKSTKWILLAAGLVVLLALAGLLIVMFTGGQGAQTDPTGTGEVATLYWNIDRDQYAGKSEAGLSSREKGDDGYYHIMFAVDGEQVEYKTSDTKIVNRIDNQKVMGLAFDDAGLITDVLEVDEITGGIIADEFYIQEVIDGVAVCNSSESFNGMSLELEITADTKIYDVNPKAEVVGAPAELAPADRVIAIQDEAGKIIYVFITSRLEKSEIYWNVSRQYDSTNKKTKRVPNENGEYEFLLAVNGEQKTFKTKSEAVATAIDKVSTKCFGLAFDADGYISEYITAAKTTGGTYFASWYDVTDIIGLSVTAERILPATSQGTVITANMTEDCQIYDVTGYMPDEVFVGQATDLRVGDRIHGLRNAKGDVVCIFVVHRLVPGAQVIWNLDRLTYWSSKQKTSLRKPNADGYYEFRVAHEGTQRVLKTKDKALVDKIDGTYTARTLAVLLDGDEITHAMSAGAAIGYSSSFASWYDVTQIQGAVVQTEKKISGSGQGNTAMGILAANVKIYNVSTAYENYQGEPTTLQVGDRIQGWKEPYGNVAYIFVVNRAIDSEIYYNVDRQYNSTTKETKRTPDWDGYYRIRLAVNGKHVTYKTKDKEVVNGLDSYRWMGLILDGDIIKRAVSTSNVKGYTGGTIFDWGDVMSISGKEVKVEKHSAAANTGTKWTATLAEDYVVYDVSTYSSFIGKKTSLNIGDRVVGLKNGDGEVAMIFVISKNTHKYGSKWSTYKWCDHCDQYVFWQPWNGSSGITGYYSSTTGKLVKYSGALGHFYVAGDLDLTGVKQIGSDGETAKCKNLDVVLDLNGYTVTSTNRVLLIAGGSSVTIVDLSGENDGKLVGMGQPPSTKKDGSLEYKSSGTIQLYQEGSTLNLVSGTIAMAEEHNPVKAGGAVNVGSKTTLNIYGGELIGADLYTTYKEETGSGSGVYGGTIRCVGTVNMYGGTVKGGKASYGGNVYITGIMNMYGGTIEGGTATSGAGNILLSGGELYMYGGTIKDGVVGSGKGGNIQAWDTNTLVISGSDDGQTNATITGGTATSGANISADKGTTITIDKSASVTNGNIYLYDGGATKKPILNLSGTPTVELFLSGIKASVDGLEEGASILVESAGVITDGTTEDSDAAYIEYFSTNVPYCDITVVDGALAIESTIKQCECAGTMEGVEGHTCVEETWTPWTSETSLPTTEGCYILTCDVTNASAQATVAENETVKLDLNGHKVIGRLNNRVYALTNESGNLVITDSSANRDGMLIAHGVGAQGGVIWARRASVKMYAGIINANAVDVKDAEGNALVDAKGNEVTTNFSCGSYGGAAVYLYSGRTFDMYGGTIIGGDVQSSDYGGGAVYCNGTFNMHGGLITGGTAKRGGAIRINSSATFNLYGGTIEEGSAVGGGNIYLNGGTLNQQGGTIADGYASGGANGGNIYILENGTYTMSAGTLTGGWSTNNGGNLYAKSGTVTIEGTATVSNGIARYTGANMYLGKEGATLYIKDDAQIIGSNVLNSENENSTIAGYTDTFGSIYLEGTAGAKSVAYMTGGTLTGGRTTRGGANVQLGAHSEFNMAGGTITGGNATKNSTDYKYVGGSVALVSSTTTFNLSGGEITGGEGYNGGNVGVTYGTFNMTGGAITNGKTRNYGGNIYAQNSTANVSITGGTVSTNRTPSSSGNMRITSSANLTIGGTANVNGGINIGTAGNVILSGTPVVMRDIDDASKVKYAGLYLSGFTNKLDISGLAHGAIVGVSAATPDVTTVLAQNVTVDQLGYLVCKNEGYSFITETADADPFVAGDMHLAEGHIHCVCGGLLAGIEGDNHECALITYEELPAPPTDSTTVTTEADHNYYLPEDVTSFISSTSKNVNLCLNGHSITRSYRAISLYGSASAPGSMTITDHATTDAEGNRTYAGAVIGGGYNRDNGGVIFGQAGQTLNIYGGNFSCNASDAKKIYRGGIIYTSGTVNLYDGVITGTNVYNKPATGSSAAATASRGGAIYASTLNMFGGKIIGGSAEQYGAVVNTTAAFNMTGGLIDATGSVAGKSGGAISLLAGTANISGGKIIGGTATEKGGIIWAWSIEDLTITGDAELVAGTASAADMGTAIYIDGNATEGTSALTINGGKITGTVVASSTANTITVGAKADVENIIITNADQKVTVNGLTDGADVTITAKDELLANGPIVIATGLVATDVPFIHCAEGYEMMENAGELYLAKAGATAAVLSIDATEETTEETTEATTEETTEATTEETTEATTEETTESTQAATEAAATEAAAQ